MIISGGGWIRDHRGERQPLQRGSIVQHLPGKEKHIVRNIKPYAEISISLDLESYRHLKSMGFLWDEVVKQSTQFEPMLIQFEQLAFAFMAEGANWTDLFSKLLELLAIIQKPQLAQRENINNSESHRVSTRPMIINTDKQDPEVVVDQLALRLSQVQQEQLNIQELYQKLPYSEAYIRRLFKKKYYLSPYGYFMQRKMALAKDMLLQDESPLWLIAQDLGFSDSFQFSRMFKKYTAYSPRDWRKSSSY